jgi:ATP-dependent DNA helicase RecQ
MAVNYPQVQSVIAKHWGFHDLRPRQKEAIEANLAGRHLLLVLPTGGGKSLCYQAPAAARTNQLTLVVSPLIALMKDQVDSLEANGIPACYINSSLSVSEREDRIQAMCEGHYRMVYVAPERLVMPEFVDLLRTLPIASIAIDEAHCISHWGHDFRPEYRQLAFLRDAFPNVPMHAFTATATEKVRSDIINQLHLENPLVMVGDFHRANLHYRVVQRDNDHAQVKSFLEEHPDQAGIIYCLRRADVDDMVAALNNWGYKAKGYHAGMDAEQRKKVQEAFRSEECNLICATVAFGMGIDRPDVRFVIHLALPKSLEHYQQESGRAGRDGLDSECVLLYSRADAVIWQKIMTKSAMEAEGDTSWLKVALAHLEEMNRYAQLTQCRHQQLVNYFGQQFPLDNCGACDICNGDAEPLADSLITAQKLLSAIARCDERFGGKHLVEVLRGESTENVLKHQHDQLSVFGLLKEHSKDEIRDWYEQLAASGLITKEEFQGAKGSGYILKLNAESWKVMRKQRTNVRLWKKKQAEPLKKGRTRKSKLASDIPYDVNLFTALQKLRRQLAGIRGVAPYVICHDTTLQALSAHRPSNTQLLLQIPGFGEAKVSSYGADFVQSIVAYCQANDVVMDVGFGTGGKKISTSSSESKSNNATQADAWRLFDQGNSVQEVAEELRRATSTVAKYLEEYLQAKPRSSTAPWLHPADAVRIREASQQFEDGRLKPLFEHFQSEFTYDQLRIALNWQPLEG